MYFLVQSNIRSQTDFQRLFQVLEELKVPYETIDLTPEITKLELKANRSDVFVYGSVRLAQLAADRTDWYPGSFYGGNHRAEAYEAHFNDYLLNETQKIIRFSDRVDWGQEQQLFMKPFREAKLFTGRVFTQQKWTDFVEETLKGEGNPYLKADSLIQVSAVRSIIREARLWIVGGEIVESVYYRFHGDIPFEASVNPEGLKFAEEMIQRFTVAEAYVMDICQTTEGWKIVEMNCINSAGFYPNTDIKKIISALVRYFD